MAKKRAYKVALILSDMHFPYIDLPLWELLCLFCKDLKPDLRVYDGDLFDFYQLSRFDKDPRRKGTMVAERDEAREHLYTMKKSSKAEDIFLPGNHEARLLKFLWKHDEVVEALGVGDMTWHSFLGLEDFGTVHDFEAEAYPILKLGNLKIFHGDRVNKHAVVNMVNDWQCSVLYGHSHRMRSFYKTTYDTTHGAWENGYLASTELCKQYIPGVADWQQGFSVVTYDEMSGWFHVDQVPVCKVPGKKVKRFMYGGQIYECKA